VVITIEGNRYRLRERTRAMGEKVDDLQTRFEELPDDASDSDSIPLILDIVDLMLEPLGDGNNGTRSHAKTVIKKEYEADRWGSDKIIGLSNFLQKKMGDRMNPFLDQPSDG
jgi:predicted nuclease with TOPRIM domain